jgi:hypothetical protein
VSESEPEKFLSQALAEMLDLPWVDGGNWVAGARSGSLRQRVAPSRMIFPGSRCCSRCTPVTS